MSELNLFSRFLAKVIREHARIIAKIERSDSTRGELCRCAREHFQKLTFADAGAADLDRRLPSETRPSVDLISQRLVFLLHPPDRGDAVLPVITLRCEFDRTPIVCRFLTALYFLRKPDNGRLRLNIFGMRFDAPEGGGTGRHDMFHLQFINGFAKDIPFQREQINTLPLPDAQPSIPLDADGAVTLLIALLVSIYGVGYLNEIVKIDPETKTYIQKMICCRIRDELRRRS
jgi:hypothetical protein